MFPIFIRATNFAPSSPLRRAQSFHLHCATLQTCIYRTAFRSISYALPNPRLQFQPRSSFPTSRKSSLRDHTLISRRMATNGEARPKRRQSPVHGLERPLKHLKVDSATLVTGDSTPANGSVYNVEDEVSSLPIINALSAANDSPEWQATIERVIKSVVSIHFCQTCSFDTDLSTSSQATGFVVDAERGYILTNRHVVCAGPFWGYCVFDNHEEVSLKIQGNLIDANMVSSVTLDLSTAIPSTTSAFSNSTPRLSSTWMCKL